MGFDITFWMNFFHEKQGWLGVNLIFKNFFYFLKIQIEVAEKENLLIDILTFWIDGRK